MKPTRTEKIKLWRVPGLESVELLRATYYQQNFDRHAHDGYAVGIIEQGALEFYYRGETVVAPHGMINLTIPGEVHDGHAYADKGWTYRMFYLDSDTMQRTTAQLIGKRVRQPFFRSGVIKDDVLARTIYQVHRLMEDPAVPLLEKETGLMCMLTQWILRHAEPAMRQHAIGDEQKPVMRARDYIEMNYGQQVSIKTLASIAGLSPYHFIRVFKKHMGLTPHAYLKQVRIKRAKQMLATNMPITQTAADSGFADQSHLSRQFKRTYGITPGQYRNFVQDALY